ncbi:hypothetical protein J6590_045768 [Homalodisca vitripennis]|nr:hypothetical protein J6590_045768 [Homalodisca vitripennis]
MHCSSLAESPFTAGPGSRRLECGASEWHRRPMYNWADPSSTTVAKRHPPNSRLRSFFAFGPTHINLATTCLPRLLKCGDKRKYLTQQG